MLSVTWNQKPSEMTPLLNIAVASIDAPAARHPDRIALIFDQGAEQPATELSYAELARASAGFAALLERNEFRPGDRMVLNLGNCPAFPIAFFGCLKAGVIAVPTSTQLVDEELAFILQDCGARGLISETERPLLGSGSALPFRIRAGQLADLIEASTTESGATLQTHPVTSADDPAYLVYTSGTTGRPKGVLHGHRSLLGRLPAATAWFDFSTPQRLLHSGQLNWTYVLGSALMDPLSHGQTVILRHSPATPACWPEMIARHRATILVGVPALYRQLLRHTDAHQAMVPTLRHCLSAGEALAETIREQWLSRFGLPIYEAVGMSECSYYISQPPGKPLVPGSCGEIQPGHQVALLDDVLQPVPRGQPGMLAIHEQDPGLFLRYWNEQRDSLDSRQQGWFRTGDYARQAADGSIYFLGRKDDLINTMGYRVSPYEVERVFRSHPDVEECICLGQTLEAGKTLLALAIIPVADRHPDTETVLAYGREHLARYKQPRLLHLVTEFPRTSNGKVLRRVLASQLTLPKTPEAN